MEYSQLADSYKQYSESGGYGVVAAIVVLLIAVLLVLLFTLSTAGQIAAAIFLGLSVYLLYMTYEQYKKYMESQTVMGKIKTYTRDFTDSIGATTPAPKGFLNQMGLLEGGKNFLLFFIITKS